MRGTLVPLEVAALVEGMSDLSLPVVVLCDQTGPSCALVGDPAPLLTCCVDLRPSGEEDSVRGSSWAALDLAKERESPEEPGFPSLAAARCFREASLRQA